MAIRRTGTQYVYNYETGKSSTVELTGEPEYVGMCIAKECNTVQVMSDIWEYHTHMLVWTGDRLTRIFIGSDYEGGRTITYSYEIDANEEICALAAAWQEGQRRGREFANRLYAYDRGQEEIQTRLESPIIKGRMVKVVRGRKVPKGTTGMVFWIGEDSYGTCKLGIATTNREDCFGKFLDVVWTAAKNCEPVNKFDGR